MCLFYNEFSVLSHTHIEIQHKKEIARAKTLFCKSGEVIDAMISKPPVKRLRNKFAIQTFIVQSVPYFIYLVMLAISKTEKFFFKKSIKINLFNQLLSRIVPTAIHKRIYLTPTFKGYLLHQNFHLPMTFGAICKDLS